MRRETKTWAGRLVAAAVVAFVLAYVPYHLYARSGLAKTIALSRDLATLRANLGAARMTNEAGWPSWFDPTPWTSLDANAIGERVPAPAR